MTTTSINIGNGTATLTRPDGAQPEVTVYLVVPDQQAASYFGVAGRSGTIVGCIVFNPRRRRWDPICYTDRRHVLDGTGPVYDLPSAKSRAAAIRALLRWWNAIDTERIPADKDPGTLSKRDCDYLTS